jgi:hypothetical protein
LIKATFRVLKGLFANLSEQKWQSVLASPTKSSIAQLSMLKINEQLQLLSEHLSEPLFEIAARLEQVHADVAALLEILIAYTLDDFSKIYRDLVAIPDSLKALAAYGIHISGMNSLTGIIKAVEKDSGAVHAIYGENTYYECAKALEKLAQSSSRADTAREEEWKRANLLIAQANPALRIEIQDEGYKVEKIEEMVRKCLSSRTGIPLTLVLDGTLDFIASSKVTKILEEFSKEILEGALTVAVIRSGNKFDLLGMDNYCGAPFFLIQNGKPSFDFLFTDPAMQCDPLSLNWFCLAYRYAASELERYKKQIFTNTRSLLDKVPKTLKLQSTSYRVIPMASEIDPSFVDIKIAGPFHKIKASGLVLPLLLIESMEKEQPIFNRPSLGFYHPNATVIFGEECSTIRLTLGLDPAQVDVFIKCLETIGAL